ncbi:hypothetical protein CDV31_010702 [Fusarium ambrosium]|uniref:Uncharacterized protein n=1 Tax=Fusarium ambrosium TaxID=131363 RepID=A0A428TLT4_9HYPO|nr:hypothetical protein CDV31_010702 [Fusarium ambrosium]
MLTLTSVETPTMDITVLDFESEGLGTRKVHSDTIVDLLEEPLPPDHRCFRWINIKHPSPDAISILREHTRLEGLGLEKELSKTQLPWDSNGYASVVLPLLYLDSSTNVPNETRNISSVQKEMIQECVYIISNSDSKVITIFDRPDHEVDNSVKAMLSRRCSSRQIPRASSLLSAVICIVVDRSVDRAMTCSERVKALELHVLTQPEEQHIQDVYLMLVSIRGIQRSLRASMRLIEALRTHESTSGRPGECEGMVNASRDGQPTVSQDPCLKVVALRCSTAIRSLDTLLEVLERCFDLLLRSFSFRWQTTRAQMLWIVVWLLLGTAILAIILKLALVK